MKKVMIFVAIMLCTTIIMAQHHNPMHHHKHNPDIVLPKVEKHGGMALLDLCAKRKTVREYKQNAVAMETLAELLWATVGINRIDGRRVIPTARNKQEVEVLVLLPTGSYLYSPKDNKLIFKTKEDLRKYAGRFDAPVYFVLVSDLEKSGKDERSLHFATMDIGYASQMVYLACANKKLATCAIGMIVDENKIKKAMRLPDTYKIQLAHSIGEEKLVLKPMPKPMPIMPKPITK